MLSTIVVAVFIQSLTSTSAQNGPVITYPKSVANITLKHGSVLSLACGDQDGFQLKWLRNSAEILDGQNGFSVRTTPQNVKPSYAGADKVSCDTSDSGLWRCERVQNRNSYSSVFVTIETGCSSNPCGIGGTCVVGTRMSFTCNCSPGFSRNLCQPDTCLVDQRMCPDNSTCVTVNQICDGQQQCLDGSDERNCFQIRLLEANVNETYEALYVDHIDVYYPLCWPTTGWNDSLNNALCSRMGYGTANRSSSLTSSASPTTEFVSLSDQTSVETMLSSLVINSSCPSGRVVVLKCNFDGCGCRGKPYSLPIAQPLLTQGYNVQVGNWPWHVYLKSRTANCSGTLIASQWVLTSAHCVQPELQYPWKFRVRLGSIFKTQYDPFAGTVGVETIIAYPDYSVMDKYINDIALVKLKSPVNFTDQIRPICLEGGQETYEDCYVTGWTNSSGWPVVVDALQEVRATVLPPTKCQEMFPAWFHQEAQYCVYGRMYLESSSCFAENGGPLVCRTSTNIWVQRGIGSFLAAGSNSSHVFTKVQHYRDFVEKYVSSVFYTSDSTDSQVQADNYTPVCGRWTCLNGAFCKDTSDGYLCTCLLGFTGRRCEIDIDECLSGPCVKDATCTDGVNGYTCICAEGYGGLYCNGETVKNIIRLASGCSSDFKFLRYNEFSFLRICFVLTMNVYVLSL